MRARRSLPLRVREDGVGVIELRPGTYRAIDRLGRTATFTVDEDAESTRLDFE